MMRRFVNIVVENYKAGMAEKYKGGMYSLHRLDVKHLFYPSIADAKMMPLLADPQANTATGCGDEPTVMERLEELPAPCTKIQPSPTDACSSKLAFFGLLSPRSSEGKVLSMNMAGDALLYDTDSNSTAIMPGLKEFKGPVPISVSISRTGAMEGDLYIMHGVPAGRELKSGFSVLRFGDTVHRGNFREGWYWQSLPLPPYDYNPRYKPALISSYTVVDGGRTICLSSAADGIVGTYCFDTVSCEWRRAGDWVLPFDGKAEYVPNLKLWLGFSLHRPSHLCATSRLSGSLMDQQPTLPIVWQDQTPDEGMATRLNLLSLGSGRFVIAKVFKIVRSTGASGFFSDWDTVEDEFVVLTGVELGRSGDEDYLQGLQMFQHKSIRYMCANNTIRWVL